MTAPRPPHQPPYGPPPTQQYGGRYLAHQPGGAAGYSAGAGPTAPRPKRKRWPWIVGGVVLLVVLIGLVARPSSPAAPPAASQATPAAQAPAAPTPAQLAPSPASNTITYEVTGDGVTKANSISYVKDANFGQQQANNVSLPWSTTVEIESRAGLGQLTSLVAQSGSGGNGSITCRILDGAGNEITSSTSSGPYAVVTCTGS